MQVLVRDSNIDQALCRQSSNVLTDTPAAVAASCLLPRNSSASIASRLFSSVVSLRDCASSVMSPPPTQVIAATPPRGQRRNTRLGYSFRHNYPIIPQERSSHNYW